MFVRATQTHIKFLLSKRSTKITFLLLFAIMLTNFFTNVMEFKGYDITAMYHPMKILTLSYNRIYYNADVSLLIVQLFPLLVNWPAGLTLAIDNGTGTETVIISRLGKRIYIISKIAATMIVTAIVFSVPFLIEITLNCISFPLLATGDLTNLNAYEPELIQMINNYPLTALFSFSPYLYAVLGTINFGLFAGLLSGFTASFSILVRVKYRVFLLLPVFLLLHISASLSSQMFRWYNYVLLFNNEFKSAAFASVSVIVIIVFCIFCILYSSKKDCLK